MKNRKLILPLGIGALVSGALWLTEVKQDGLSAQQFCVSGVCLETAGNGGGLRPGRPLPSMALESIWEPLTGNGGGLRPGRRPPPPLD